MKKLVILSILAALTLVAPAVFSNATAISNPYKNDTSGEKYVALSFDDGPDPRFTPSVLEILEQYGVRATFFVVGSEAQKHPEILAMINRQGHELANHTWTHPHMAEISAGELMAEVESTNQLINGLTGGENNFFRPPRGQLTKEQGSELEKAGYIVVMWDIGIENSKTSTPGEMAERVLKKIKPGGIILLHDGLLDRTRTIQALPILLEGLRDKGYRTTTVGRLLGKK